MDILGLLFFRLFFLFFVTVHFVHGQNDFSFNRDYDNLKFQTIDTSSSLFYNKLLTRFTDGDTSLQSSEILALMVGFTDKSAYQPNDNAQVERKIFHLNAERNYNVALKYCDSFLKTNPLSKKAIIEKSYSLHKLGNSDDAMEALRKLNLLLNAMNMSGRGESPEDPILALSPNDPVLYIDKYLAGEVLKSEIVKNKNGLPINKILVSKSGSTTSIYFVIPPPKNVGKKGRKNK